MPTNDRPIIGSTWRRKRRGETDIVIRIDERASARETAGKPIVWAATVIAHLNQSRVGNTVYVSDKSLSGDYRCEPADACATHLPRKERS